jgi:hypothetical protein
VNLIFILRRSRPRPDIVFRDRARGKPLAFVLFSGHPERQSGARVAANDALDADHVFYRCLVCLICLRVGVVWLGGTREVDRLLAAG